MSQTATAEVLSAKRVATYERVSSEDQRQRETIKSQTDALAIRLDHDPSVEPSSGTWTTVISVRSPWQIARLVASS